MALALPAPSTEKLERSPLILVVCQVRHEENNAARDPKRAFQVHEAIKDHYPVLEEQVGQQLTITAGAAGVQAVPGAQQRGWKMRSEDQQWNAVVMPDSFSLETTSYSDWPDFSARFEVLTRAVAAAIEPSLEQRVGLRFIDRITHPDVASARDWARWIDEAFLGPIAHKTVGEAVTSSQQIVQLDAGEGRSMILRHGAIRDADAGGEWAYLFDQDCYVQRGRRFDSSDVLAALESLHTLALQVFQQAITAELYEYLKGEK
jgi:uncharacterized protein (TIGR04255 family)